MIDWCSHSPDGFFGVDWSMSCKSHDGRYDTKGTSKDKIQADLDLTRDVWAVAALADTPVKTGLIRAWSIVMLVGTSTAGWYNWFDAQKKVKNG